MARSPTSRHRSSRWSRSSRSTGSTVLSPRSARETINATAPSAVSSGVFWLSLVTSMSLFPPFASSMLMISRDQKSRLHQHVCLFAELTQWCLGSFLVLSFGEAGRTVSLLLGPTLSVLVCSQLCRRTMLGAEVEPSDPAIGVTDRSVVVAGGSPLLPCHV